MDINIIVNILSDNKKDAVLTGSVASCPSIHVVTKSENNFQ